jgi:hypothetical protein
MIFELPSKNTVLERVPMFSPLFGQYVKVSEKRNNAHAKRKAKAHEVK